MAQDLERSVIRILNQSDATVGTGFVVADGLAVTCAHVVKAAGSDKDELLFVQFYADESQQIAQVLTEGWSPPEADDVAFLQLEDLPEGVVPVMLGSARNCEWHPYFAFGFARLASYDSRKVTDILDGIVSVLDKRKHPMLQLKGEEIDRGLSGSPVLDKQTNRVVGMVSEYQDNQRTRFAWATTADTLSVLNRTLQLWPNTYGSDELNAYLDYLIDSAQILTLPDGNEVQLERVYVSLRADEMNALERQAEHKLYLEDVATLQKLPGETGSDEYARFAAIRKVIARRPRMQMLEARNWTSLFGAHEQDLLSLAEVVQRHSHVVLLGDPGSGKTTLGKWLVLQFARALRKNETRVQVRADLVRPGDESNRLIDLGPIRLPILIRIADYARLRWDKEQGDTGISLEGFLTSHQAQKILPAGLMPEAVGALIKEYLSQGRAIIVLDGLDEVGDPTQRKAIMQAVRRFLQPQPLVERNNRWADNRVLLTSRIVGYQFDPLTHLPHYTVEDMDETAIGAFCQAWMRHVAKAEDAAEEAQQLKDAIFNHAHPGVRALAGNPLLLTILAQVYWSNTERKLPALRVELFEKATQALYNQRRVFWRLASITVEDLVSALGAVAVHIHANEVTGFAEEGTVKAQLNTILKDQKQVQAVLEVAREVSGFLVARGEGVYGFLHRSLQEYFAAQHLVRQPEQVAENLVLRVLDPVWREPTLLAIGIVSQPSYPDSRHRLSEVFEALLDIPDPAGDFLPRRELLAAAACAECERVPVKVGQQIAQSLLSLYAQRKGPGKSPVLRRRIQRAFAVLRDSYIKEAIESVLCTFIEHSDVGHRYAAIDLIIETQWGSSAVARALLRAWQTYPDPAASLLIALENLTNHNPASFQENDLPLRQAMTIEHGLWERLNTRQEWQVVIRTLYLSQDADYSYNRINRDSPLTEQVLAALRRLPAPTSWATFRQELVNLAGQPGTSSARDAALVLSALGDASWVAECVANAGEQESKLCPIIACLARELALARTLVCDHALALTRFLDLARTRTEDRSLIHKLDFAGDRSHALAKDLDLIRDLPSPSVRDNELNIIHELARIRARALADQFALVRDSDLASIYQLARTLLHSLTEKHDPARELALSSELARESGFTHEHEPKFARKHETDRGLAADRALVDELSLACTHDLTRVTELARALQLALKRAREHVRKGVRIPENEFKSARKLLARERTLARERERELAYEREHELNQVLPLIRDLALDRALVDELDLARTRDLARIPELTRLLQIAQQRVREQVRQGAYIPDHERESARKLIARERELTHELEQAHMRIRVLDRALAGEFNFALVPDLVHALAYDDELATLHNRARAQLKALMPDLIRIRERARARELTLIQDIAHARNRKFGHNDGLDFDSDLANIYALVRDSPKITEPYDFFQVFAPASDLDRARARELARDLALDFNLTHASHSAFARVLAQDNELTLIHTLALARANALARAQALVHALVRARELDLTLDRQVAFDPASIRALVLARDRALEIDRSLQSVNIPSTEDTALLMWAINSARASIQTIQRIVDACKAMTQVRAILTELSKKHWSTEAKLPTAAGGIDEVKVTAEGLTTLIADLVCPNDRLRERAHRVMNIERLASELSEAAIERMAELVQSHPSRGEASLEWILQRITYDTPSWVAKWIEKSKGTGKAAVVLTILRNISRATSRSFEVLLNALPDVEPQVNAALLESLSRMARNRQIPDERQNDVQRMLLAWLEQGAESDIRRAIIEALGHSQDALGVACGALLARLSRASQGSDDPALYEALARLAARHQNNVKQVRDALQANRPHPAANAALARLNLMEMDRRYFYESGQRKHQDLISAALLSDLSELLHSPSQILIALLDAGSDSDIWNDRYHGILANTVRVLVEGHSDLRSPLLTYAQQALLKQNWPARRIALAAVANCIEVMPVAIQEVFPGGLEDLLVRGTVDADSYTSRRFALTALSYLRTVTPQVIPALLAGCRDIPVVQQDAIAAAGRFQSIEGNLLPTLVAELSGESVSTAYAVAQLLGALGASSAGENTDLQGQMIEALVAALKSPSSQREVIISGEHKGKLEDALYAALLMVTG